MLVAFFTAVLTLSSAPADTAVRNATKELLGDRGVQKKLPKAQKKADAKSTKISPTQRRRMERRRARRGKPATEARFGSSLGRGAMYMAMAIVIAVLLFKPRGRRVAGFRARRPVHHKSCESTQCQD